MPFGAEWMQGMPTGNPAQPQPQSGVPGVDIGSIIRQLLQQGQEPSQPEAAMPLPPEPTRAQHIGAIILGALGNPAGMQQIQQQRQQRLGMQQQMAMQARLERQAAGQQRGQLLNTLLDHLMAQQRLDQQQAQPDWLTKLLVANSLMGGRADDSAARALAGKYGIEYQPGTSYSEVLQQAKPAIENEKADADAARDLLRLSTGQRVAEQTAATNFTKTWPQRMKGLESEISSAIDTATKLKIPGIAEDLQAKQQQLQEAVDAASVDPSAPARSNVDRVIADIHRTTAAARKLSVKVDRVDNNDRNNVQQLDVMEGMVNQALDRLAQEGDIGGPIAGSTVGKAFTALTSPINQANYSAQATFDPLLQDIASTIANMKGGKAITATEIRLFSNTLPRLNMPYQRKVAALNQIMNRINLARQSFIRIYGQDVLEALKAGGAQPGGEADIPGDLQDVGPR